MRDTLAAHNFHLKEIKFNNTLTTIFVNAFLNCVRLRKLDLPASLEHISAGGFQGLVFMETYIFRNTIPPTLANASNCITVTPNLTKIYVPDDSVSAYKTATNWATYESYIYPLSEYIE